MPVEVPKYHELMNPVIRALYELGGSASIPEMVDKVVEILGLSDDVVEIPHRGGMTKLEYNMAWARSYLKAYGVVDNSERGVWSLTSKGKQVDSVDTLDVRRVVRSKWQEKTTTKVPEVDNDHDDGDAEPEVETSWKDELLQILMGLEPAAFERLCQRMLRESGFVEVEVTGRTGDGGVDGKGIMRLNPFLSMRVVFQCKRYQGTVSSAAVRDFRGAMVGRADKGLLITTGTFSRDARAEATRDGAPPIDLVDGDDLAEQLKRLGLGVSTKVVEEVEVETEWFSEV